MKLISVNATSNSSGASSLTDLTLVPSAPSPVGCHPAADESSLTKLGQNVPDIRSAATLKFEEEMKRITDSVGKSETQRPVEAPPEAPPGLSANAGDPCQKFLLTAAPTTIQESQDEVKNPSTPIAGRRRRTRADSWWVRGGPITELFQLHTPEEVEKNTARRKEIENGTPEMNTIFLEDLDDQKRSLLIDNAGSGDSHPHLPDGADRDLATESHPTSGASSRDVQIQAKPDQDDKSVQTDKLENENIQEVKRMDDIHKGDFVEDELSDAQIIDGVLCKDLCMAEPQGNCKEQAREQEKDVNGFYMLDFGLGRWRHRWSRGGIRRLSL